MTCMRLLCVLGALTTACRTDTPAPAREPATKASTLDARPARPDARIPEGTPHEVLSPELLQMHTRALSDDAMEGRKPGTRGATKAVEYIVTAMRDLGLEPAGENDFTQKVSMRAVKTDAEASTFALASTASDGKATRARPLTPGEDVVLGSFGPAGSHALDLPLIFAGYGITAPEYDWDDYAHLDATGKIVVVLVGDPPVTDDRFEGKALTYYGRWSYKFERALEANAAGCLVVHETEPASYGWHVVRTSWGGERFHIVEPSGELPPALRVQGWLSAAAADALARSEGDSLERWHELALAPDFRPRPLRSTLQGTLVTHDRRLFDYNVVGKIPGAARPEQAVMVTAHWDHLGVRTPEGPDDDPVFNGAVDNASGVAGLLAIAAGIQARVRAGRPPARSILVLATTAEEQGLLGSRYYAAHPLHPLEDLLAVVNLDSMNVHGRTKTVQVIGRGQSSLEDLLEEIVAAQGRRIVDDEHPESGGYFRSDHFSFAQRGVPALYFRGGNEMEEGGLEAGRELATLRAERYHTEKDEFDPAWPFTGAEQDAEAVMDLLLRVSDATERPQWKPGSPFGRQGGAR